MTTARWRRIRELFDSVCDLGREEQRAFLSESCAHDAQLRREVEELLQSSEEAPTFFEAPPGGLQPRFSDDELTFHWCGRRLGAYQLLEQIGSGGMGTVFLAERIDGQYDKHVAIKLIKSAVVTEEQIRRFRNERQVLAALDHPNITGLLDGGVTDAGVPYLVMEYVDGTPVNEFCEENRLSTVERLNLFHAICSAVHYAHQHLVVHRDLKPSNILVTPDGVPKLLDFGIAKVLDPDRSRAQTTIAAQRIMTPEYSSPEQIRGEALSTPSDIYSLGVILYELLTGRRPHRFTSGSLYEIERAIARDEPRKPSAVVRDHAAFHGANGESGAPQRHLDRDIDAIVLMAMHKEPSRRYATVEQFADDIRRFLKRLPVRARKDTLGYRASKFLRRNKAVALASGAAALSLLIGTGGVIWQGRIAARERDVALRAQGIAEVAAESARTEARKAERINSFLQDMLASAAPGNKGRSVMVREVLDDAARRVAVELAEFPEVEAAARATLGRTYHGLGLYEEAEAHLEAALKLYEESHGTEHPEVATALRDLALLLDDKGDYEASELLMRRALALRRQLFGDEHPMVAVTLNDLAGMLHSHGSHAEADPVVDEALRLFERMLAEEDPRMDTDIIGLAAHLHARGESAAAESLMRRTLAVHRKLLGDHRLVARDLRGLADYSRAVGEYSESERLYREALAMQKELLGDEHPEVAETLNDLATTLHGKGDFEAAEAIYLEALAMRRRVLGEQHADVAQSLFDLSMSMQARGDLVGAESAKREALALRRRLPVGDLPHPQVIDSLHDLAIFWHRQGDYAEAERLCREALALERAIEPQTSLAIANKLYSLALILIDKGDPAEAESLLREALELRKRIFPEGHWTMAVDRSVLGECLGLLGRYGEAEPLLLQSYRLLSEKLGKEHRRTKKSLKRIVALYEAWQKPGQAATYRAEMEGRP